jgi:hypothetical protein
MDIITAIRLIIISPVATFIILIGLFYLLRHHFKLNALLSDFMKICFKWAAITAGASLVALGASRGRC